MRGAAALGLLNPREGRHMDPNLGSLVLTELVLSLIDEAESLDPGARERLLIRAIKRAREGDHERVPDVVAVLEGMRQGIIGS